MTITAKIIADSVSQMGVRLTTMQLRYPRIVHSEFMTHRMFSRNASSSRAIPVERLIQDVMDDPAMPVFWGKNQPGMQAAEELEGRVLHSVKSHWLMARDTAVYHARMMVADGAHKQIVNRIIEPWCHINVVVTATEWSNFFALRQHADAQPEIHALADAMWEARESSAPTELKIGEWHLPYVDVESRCEIRGFIDRTDYFTIRDLHGFSVSDNTIQSFAIMCSVARCARVSYLTHDGKPPNVEEDLKLYDRLVGSTPLHASPAEHQATPDTCATTLADSKYGIIAWQNLHQHGNLHGWRQYRKMLPNECVRDR